jgi:cell division protein FtsL
MLSALLVLFVVIAAVLVIYRVAQNRKRARRREAQQIKRAEHERIWQEKIGDPGPPVDRR